MKAKHLLIFLFLNSCLIQLLQAQDLKLFSKYNYYTTEEFATLVCIQTSSQQYDSIEVFNTQKERIKKVTLENTSTHIQLPIDLIPMGNTALPVRLFSGQTKKDTLVHFSRLKQTANEVKINRETGGLMVDNLPFFPFSFYCGKVGDLPEQEVVNGFNTIGPYQSNLPEGLAERKAYMDRCAELGVKVQYGVNSLIGSGHNGSKGLDMTEDEKFELLKKEILAFKDHPALLSWYINDEPAGQGRPHELMEKTYRFIHQMDPYHPISIVFMMPSKAGAYKNGMDIAMTDPYPIPKSVTEVQDYVKGMNQQFRYEKSIWLVPQAFGGSEMWPREPTPKEIRAMTYLGIIEGVQGIQYFIHTASNLNPQSVAAWSECRNMAVEINQMTPFLLNYDKTESLTTNQKQVLAKSFYYKGDELVVAVNTTNQPANYQINLKENANTTAELWFENRSVECNNGIIEDIIDAHSTRVYLIRKEENKSPNIGNLIYNPGFEKVSTPGLSDGHHLSFASSATADVGTTVFSDSRQCKEGLFSLRIINTADHAGKKVMFLPNAITKGATYRFSIWAKAKSQTSMPNFKIDSKALKTDKTFSLTPDWKEYSFMVHSDSSSTNNILGLELINKGTAWFDQIQLSLEPVISYQINKAENNALLSIQTSIPGSTIKYRAEGKKFQNYQTPFSVSSSTTIEAAVFQGQQKVAESSLLVPINKAMGKTVTFETQVNEKYSAQGKASLTNGIMGSTVFKDGNWMGFIAEEVAYVIDLGTTTKINTVTPNFLCDPNSGIFLPREVSIYQSYDGKDFKLVKREINQQVSKRGEPYLVPISVNCKNVKTRYIRVAIKPFGTIPEGYLFKGTTSWLFTDEVMVQ